jgi:arylsulfatase A-like enzyme
MFLLDDTNPMDGRLWNNPSLTPTLYDKFVAHGTFFPNAIDDTPLCCPARATLLTGLHSFNHGVTVNNVQLFNPSESIAVEMDKVNYQTMLIGKYMNKSDSLTTQQFAEHAAPWSVFDIFTSPFSDDEGFFYDYQVTTKDGQVLMPSEHSTQWVTDTAVQAMAATDPSKPIFAELSIVDTHRPALPMPQFVNDTRCDSMPPWDPPNYNEADVSDKPAYVQKTPLLPFPDGWPMVSYCKEMLGVDWMVKQVTDELAAEGRLDNTLLVFTGDNGMSWGQHRQQLKETPYATKLPLYMSWPARWGTNPRTINEYTSNIDMAPTFCDVASCTLGPYPTGQLHPDGVSLLPLLDGDVQNLGRDALLETEYRIHPWAAVRTTPLSPLGLWHYVEYQSGFRELYNLAPNADPWELNNVAYQPHNQNLIAALHTRLVQLLSEGRPAQPATLTVIEDSVPNGGQNFNFDGDFGSFALDDDSDPTLSRKKVFTDVTPGTYAINQVVPSGWTLSSISCPVPSEVDPTTGTASVTLLADTNVTCTFKNVRRLPDLSIALSSSGSFNGDNIYSASVLKSQTQSRNPVTAGQEYDYFVNVQNDGKENDSFVLKASVTGSPKMSATFWVNGGDVTSGVLSGTFTTPVINSGATIHLEIRVVVAADAIAGDKKNVVLRGTSVAAPGAVDTVRALTID